MSLFEMLGLQSLHRSEQCVWHHRQIQRLYGIHDHLRRAFERRDRRTPLVKPRMHTVPPASNVSASANTSELSLESFENFFVFKFSNKGLFIRALSSKYHIAKAEGTVLRCHERPFEQAAQSDAIASHNDKRGSEGTILMTKTRP
ncbi:hypothetical protein F444_15396 [Phytophthora nicotianae P1976]|uniref:Uncharacterized protein n=1 Tax=Phytophthora nicotianae P1976 TaxID=1317066 RepID=A0A080ZM43_PHYNI|nr:hypothetical protein F444_15396 [Phytophthora nicotianae P1976]